MNPATFSGQEMALAYLRLPQAQPVLKADYIPALKLNRFQAFKSCSTDQIVFSQVDIALYVAAFRATGLALESNSL